MFWNSGLKSAKSPKRRNRFCKGLYPFHGGDARHSLSHEPRRQRRATDGVSWT